MEADLARYYPGTRLVDVWRPGGGLTYRRLMNLIRWLPKEAATWACLGRASLSIEAHIIASIWEALAEELHPSRPGPVYEPPGEKDPDATPSPGGDWTAKLLEHRSRYQPNTDSTAP